VTALAAAAAAGARANCWVSAAGCLAGATPAGPAAAPCREEVRAEGDGDGGWTKKLDAADALGKAEALIPDMASSFCKRLLLFESLLFIFVIVRKRFV